MTPWGLYEWNRIPFGLMNAPATFQRFMEETVHDYRDECIIPYLDDLIVYSKKFEDHLNHVDKILGRIIESGLKLNIAKCDFFKSSVKFLGRTVTKDGYKIDTSNVEAVTSLKEFEPKNVTDVRHILGLIGYHRRHIPDFSRRAKPITNILKQNEEDVKNNKRRKINWTAECKEALGTLIEDITTAPILAYPDFEQEFIIHTDASNIGLGAVLCQNQEGVVKVIAYASRTLSKAEEKYHSTKLEFLALKWAITEVFKEYIGYANHFTVFTDNNPLVYLMESKKLNAYTERWISELSEHNFTLNYRPGVANKDADCLSRIPCKLDSYRKRCSETINPDVFRAILANVETNGSQEAWRCVVHSLNTDNTDSFKRIPEEWINENVKRIASEQLKDPEISVIIELLKNETTSKIAEGDSSELKNLKRIFKKLRISEEGILTKIGTSDRQQIVLPKSMRGMIYQNLHVDMGHMGPEKVL